MKRSLSFSLVQKDNQSPAHSSLVMPLRSLGCIMISGNEAAKFLQGQLTCDINQIQNNKGALSAYCNPQGRVIASFYVAKKGEAYVLVLPKTMVGIVVNKLAKFAVFSKVKVEDKSDDFTSYGFYLEKGQEDEVLTQIQSAELFYFQFFPHYYLMLLEHDQLSKTDDLFVKLSVAMTEEKIWQEMHVQEGITFIHPETCELVTPHMINYPWLGAVVFNKGCYVGQEIIARTHYLGKSKRKLYRGHTTSTMRPQIGEKLWLEDKEVGIIMECCCLNDGQYQMLAVIQDQIDLDTISFSSA